MSFDTSHSLSSVETYKSVQFWSVDNVAMKGYMGSTSFNKGLCHILFFEKRLLSLPAWSNANLSSNSHKNGLRGTAILPVKWGTDFTLSKKNNVKPYRFEENRKWNCQHSEAASQWLKYDNHEKIDQLLAAEIEDFWRHNKFFLLVKIFLTGLTSYPYHAPCQSWICSSVYTYWSDTRDEAHGSTGIAKIGQSASRMWQCTT